MNAKTMALLARLAPYQQRVNDVLFAGLDARRFRQLRALAGELVAGGERAVALLEFIEKESEGRAA
jgi:hypothetical protein